MGGPWKLNSKERNHVQWSKSRAVGSREVGRINFIWKADYSVESVPGEGLAVCEDRAGESNHYRGGCCLLWLLSFPCATGVSRSQGTKGPWKPTGDEKRIAHLGLAEPKLKRRPTDYNHLHSKLFYLWILEILHQNIMSMSGTFWVLLSFMHNDSFTGLAIAILGLCSKWTKSLWIEPIQ